MRNLRVLTLCLSAALLLAGSAFATPDHEEKVRKIKVVATDGDEASVINVEDDLALGETREIVTDEGKTITISRSLDDEVTVLVDGEEIVIPEHDGEHRRITKRRMDGEGDGSLRKVIVRRHVEEDCEGEDCEGRRQVRKVFVVGDDEDLDVEVLDLGSEHSGIDFEDLAVQIENLDLDIDCESDEEDCETKILEVLSDTLGEGGKEVIVIKKRIVREDEEE